MQEQIDKHFVKERFMKASFSYNKQAVAQKQIVGQLMHKMARFIPVQIHSALEIGCGSGLLTNLFLQHFSAKKLILNDLLPIQEPLREILGSRDFCFREEDAENLELNEKVDLIFSSSTFQWFVNQDHFFKRCAGLLNKQGILAFSSFVPGNLSEIKELTGVGLNYRKKEELIASLKEHFDILDISDKTIKMNFDSPRAVLRHLSETGVTGIQSFRWTKDNLLLFTEEYLKKFPAKEGVSLTYHPVFVIAKIKATK